MRNACAILNSEVQKFNTVKIHLSSERGAAFVFVESLLVLVGITTLLIVIVPSIILWIQGEFNWEVARKIGPLTLIGLVFLFTPFFCSCLERLADKRSSEEKPKT